MGWLTPWASETVWSKTSTGKLIGNRWALKLTWFAIMLTEQYLGEDGARNWRDSGYYYTFAINGTWRFWFHHIYWDGPHCSFSLGPIHYNWSGVNGCKICEGEDP